MSEENAPDQCSEQPGDRPEPFLELQGGVISECYTTIDSEEEHRIYVYTHQILEDGSQVTRAHVEHSRGWVEPSHRQLTLEGARELARRDEAIAGLLYAFGDELGLKAVRMVIEHNLTARQAYEVVSAFGDDDTLLDMACRLADHGYSVGSIVEMVRLGIRIQSGVLERVGVNAQAAIESFARIQRAFYQIGNMGSVSPANPSCVGCRHYHGQAYNGVMFVCGMYPYGWEGEEKCPDRESSYD